MAAKTDNPYLRDAVLTAPPEQLQLMLYNGAIRFATQAREALQAGDSEKSFNLLTRAQKIILELINGLREEVNPPLVRQMASLYMFIYRKLVHANINRDATAIEEALKLLAYQRETWVLLLSKLRSEESAPKGAPPVRVPPSMREPRSQPQSDGGEPVVIAARPAAPRALSLEG